jgi:glycosyltransferase involved in cell wall biosynthesis
MYLNIQTNLDGDAGGKQDQIMRGNNRPYVSVIVPVYNEDERLSSGVEALRSYLATQPYASEILLVDDGSKRDVRGYIKQSSRFRVVRLPQNIGKGGAIKKGVEEAKGDMIVFSDIDMSVPVETISYILRKLKQFPVVITSRRHARSRIVVHQSWAREVSGRMFTYLAKNMLGLSVSDVTCGMKGFRSDAAKMLFEKSIISRWVFDAEVLFLAKKFHMEVREIPVAWSNKTGSKVRAGDSTRSFVDLIMIRFRDMRGVYDVSE